ncbi:MAG: hypothetical protein ACLSGS_00240 [Adlercreutzia sp.]
MASTVEVAAVNKMRADLAAMGVYFEVARRPENLGYVVKFNAKDASMVERALCELDQAYGHPQSAQDVARAVAGYLPSPAEGVWKREGARSTLEARNAGQDEVLAAAHVYPENGGWHVYGEAAGSRRRRLRHRARGRAGGRAARGAEGRRVEARTSRSRARELPRATSTGGKAGDYTLTMTTVEWDRAANIMGGPSRRTASPSPVLRRGGGNRFAHLRVRARRRRQGHRRPLYQIVEGELRRLHHCALRGLGRVLKSPRRDGEGRRPAAAIRAEWIDVGDGGRWHSLEAYANAYGTPKPSSACRCTPRPSWNRPVPRGMGGMGNADGPNFGEADR